MTYDSQISEVREDLEGLSRDRDELQEELANTQERVRKLEQTLEQLRQRSAPGWLGGNGWILATLLIVIAVVVVLVWRGWAATPTVSIDFSAGEMIGGVLVGSAALVAGASYAKRRREDW
jgi:Flp pilus assembly protein TadB